MRSVTTDLRTRQCHALRGSHAACVEVLTFLPSQMPVARHIRTRSPQKIMSSTLSTCVPEQPSTYEHDNAWNTV